MNAQGTIASNAVLSMRVGIAAIYVAAGVAGKRPARSITTPITPFQLSARRAAGQDGSANNMPHYTLTLTGRTALALGCLCITAGFIVGRFL